jgi:hypothetical protein
MQVAGGEREAIQRPQQGRKQGHDVLGRAVAHQVPVFLCGAARTLPPPAPLGGVQPEWKETPMGNNDNNMNQGQQGGRQPPQQDDNSTRQQPGQQQQQGERREREGQNPQDGQQDVKNPADEDQRSGDRDAQR